MTTLAVSDSPLARTLLREQKLSVPVETGGPLTASAVEAFPEHPWLLHNSVWNWSLAHPRALEQQDVLAVTRRALLATRAPWLSVHLGFSADSVTFQGGFQTASVTLERSVLVDRLVRNVSALKTAVEVPLLLENLDYNATGAYEHICEPEVIGSVLEATTPTSSSICPTPRSARRVWATPWTIIWRSCRWSACGNFTSTVRVRWEKRLKMSMRRCGSPTMNFWQTFWKKRARGR